MASAPERAAVDPFVAEISLEAECSALAADAMAAAYCVAEQHPKGGGSAGGCFIVGRTDFPGGKQANISPLGGRIEFEGGSAELAIIQPTREEDSIARYSRKNRRLQKRPVAGPLRRPDGSPFLAIVVDDYVCLTLAGFERREAGTCHFVQLGSEMRDDDYFMSILDENTSRFDYVKQILALLEHSLVNRLDGHNLPADQLRLVKRLAAEEARTRQDELLDAKAAHLVRSAFFKALYAKQEATLQIIDQAAGTFEPQTVKYNEIGFRSQLPDGRVVRLALARDPGWTKDDNGGPIELVAITRGDLALPLATFQQADGSISFHGHPGEVTTEQRKAMLDGLTNLFNNLKPPSIYGGQCTFWNSKTWMFDNHTYLIADICIELGLLDSIEFRLPDKLSHKGSSYKSYMAGQGVEDAKVIRDYFRRSESCKSEFEDDEVMQKAIRFMRAKQAVTRSFVETLGVQQRLRTVLGECTPDEELLIDELHWMAQQRAKFSGVIGGALLGRHHTKLYVEAEVDEGDLNYALRMSAVQNTRRELPPDLRLHETIDVRRPVHESWSRPDAADWIASTLAKLRQLEPEDQPGSSAVTAWPVSYTVLQWYTRKR